MIQYITCRSILWLLILEYFSTKPSISITLTDILFQHGFKNWLLLFWASLGWINYFYYGDIIMSAMAPQITGVSIVCLTICPGLNHTKHQSFQFAGPLWGESPVFMWWRHHEIWNGQSFGDQSTTHLCTKMATASLNHDDVMPWAPLPRYCPF